jgi:hypothetical protein
MDNLKCNRCHAKEAVFTCLMCDSFKTLCTKCDTYIHNLPSKKAHKRQAINNENHVSMTVQPDSKGEWKVDMTITANVPEVNNINTINNVNLGNPLATPKTVHSIGSFNSLNSINTETYTKEYVNELKV